MQKRIWLGVIAVAALSITGYAWTRTSDSPPVTVAVETGSPVPSGEQTPTTAAETEPEPAEQPAPEAPAEPSTPAAQPSVASAASAVAGEAPHAVTVEQRATVVADRHERPAADRTARTPLDLTPYLQTLLRLGDSGAAVEALQSELDRKDGYGLAVTGVFDEETDSTVRDFQSHMGLEVDGVVGPATWSALRNHFVELEWSGYGWYRYWTLESDSSWGTEATVATVKRVAAQWVATHGTRIGINDISLPHGGPFPPHSSHRNGREVDIRVMRSDGAEAGVAYTDPTYSRSLTQELVNLLWATGQVEVILFNDPAVEGVQPWAGHDDHLHVRFSR